MIPIGPTLQDFAVRESAEGCSCQLFWPLIGLSDMRCIVRRTTSSPMQIDRVACCRQSLDRYMELREGSAKEGNHDLDCLGAVYRIGDNPAMIDVCGSEESVGHGQFSLIPDILHDELDHGSITSFNFVPDACSSHRLLSTCLQPGPAPRLIIASSVASNR